MQQSANKQHQAPHQPSEGAAANWDSCQNQTPDLVTMHTTQDMHTTHTEYRNSAHGSAVSPGIKGKEGGPGPQDKSRQPMGNHHVAMR